MPIGLLSCTAKYNTQTLRVLHSIPSLKFSFNNSLFFFPLPVSVDFQSTVNLTKLNNINTAARYELEGYAGPFLPDAVTTVDAKVGQACSAKYVLLQLSSGILFIFVFLYFVIPCRKFGLPFLGEAQQLQERCYPFLIITYIYHTIISALSAHITVNTCILPMCAVFLLVQTVAELPAFHIFNMHTNVDACNCSQRLYKCFRESALKIDSGEDISYCIEESKPCQNCAWLFSLMLCQQR